MKILAFLRQNPTFDWLISSALVGLLGFSMLLPLTALRLAALGVSAARIGFFSAVPWLVILATSFLIPVAVQRWGFRRMMVVASFLGAIVVPGFILTQIYWIWCLVNSLFGFSIAVRWVLVESWMMQNAPPSERGRFFGLYEGSLAFLFAVGPALLAVTGTVGNFPFLVPLILFIISWILILFAGSMGDVSHERSARNAFQGPIIRMDLVLMLAAFVGGVHEVGTTAVGPVYGLTKGLLPSMAAQVATLIGAGSFLAQYPVGALSDRRGAAVILKIALLLLLFVPLILLMVPNVFLSVGGMGFIWGGVGGGLYTLSIIQLAGHYQGSDLVRGTARVVFAYTLGSIVGPILGGWAIGFSPAHGLPVVLMILTSLCALAVWKGSGLHFPLYSVNNRTKGEGE